MTYSSKIAWIMWLYAGIFLVVLVAAAVRYWWLIGNHIETNMPPSAALLTSPFLAAVLWVGALLVELAIRIVDRRPRPSWHYALIGASYCSVMMFSVSVLAGTIASIAINPLTLRFCLGLHGKRADGGRTPA